MIKLKLFSVGKTKERWLNEAFEMYVKRLEMDVLIECQWFKNIDLLESNVSKEKNIICLDLNGDEMTSENFSKYLFNKFELFGSRLTFIIGDDLGLPDTLKRQFPTISLSKLTFTHQIARLVLLEQIYRAFEIAKGTPYHK